MKIEAGKLYRTRDKKTLVLVLSTDHPDRHDPVMGFATWWGSNPIDDHLPLCWTADGHFVKHYEMFFDLIEEVDDPIFMAFIKIEYENSLTRGILVRPMKPSPRR